MKRDLAMELLKEAASVFLSLLKGLFNLDNITVSCMRRRREERSAVSVSTHTLTHTHTPSCGDRLPKRC